MPYDRTKWPWWKQTMPWWIATVVGASAVFRLLHPAPAWSYLLDVFLLSTCVVGGGVDVLRLRTYNREHRSEPRP